MTAYDAPGAAREGKLMRRKRLSILPAILLATIALLTGCGRNNTENTADAAAPGETVTQPADTGGEPAAAPTALTVRFGDDGAPFTMQLEDNETAAAIAGYVGTAAWRLPIYHYDDFENWEVMQYYDIPSRYEVPAAPTAISSEKAGEVYYAEPGRIVLFYQDAEVAGEYTKIGTFAVTDEFQTAVTENPVLEGWGNKIVHISAEE